VTDTLGLVTHRADALARRLAGNDAVGGAEVTDLLLLAALNRAAALFTHLSEFVGLHPERLFAELVQLAGEIASFTTPTRRNAVFPAYRHTNLEASFRPVIDDLRRSLTSVLDRRAVAIPLTERKYGILTGHIADLSLVGEAQFVLVARSSFSAPTIARVLPAQVKVGPTEIIRDLVNSSLPGIGLRALPSAPRVLPFYGNATYFELAADSPLWARMRISGAVALHVAGEFTDLEVELWAIRSP
jgi:type VI secretion system protein ImpJ